MTKENAENTDSRESCACEASSSGGLTLYTRKQGHPAQAHAGRRTQISVGDVHCGCHGQHSTIIRFVRIQTFS